MRHGLVTQSTPPLGTRDMGTRHGLGASSTTTTSDFREEEITFQVIFNEIQNSAAVLLHLLRMDLPVG